MAASFFSKLEHAEDRRAKIALAMDDCVREKGYSATSLTDIAVKAKMSPSHIRYYFDGKEEILEFYLARVCDQIIHDIGNIPKRSPLQWLRQFTGYFITHPNMTRGTIAVLVEIFAVSMHNPKLSKIKIGYDDFIRKTFVDFFRWAGTVPGLSAEDAAYRAWALEIGMKFNAVFQADFSKERAGKVFLKEALRMAGLGEAGQKRKSL